MPVKTGSEMMFDAMSARGETHLILLSCDGDYAEMIKKLLRSLPKLHITVLATPYTTPVNFLSKRLMGLTKELGKQYLLRSMLEIKDKVS